MKNIHILFLPIICLCSCMLVISSENREDSAEKTLKFVDDAQTKLILANNSDIILVIGNTGTGKSTLVHFLTGDLRKLTSIAPDDQHTDYTVRDELDVAKGQTTSITESRTLVPEMIEDEEHLLWYDCPGFGDTRNTTVEIANAFLIKNLIESASRVKLVLVTDYASVTTSRYDFDLLLNRTTQLVKDIDHFYGSISLIVTKVPPLKFRGKSIVEMLEDRIKTETVQFIKGHREYLMLNSLGSVHKIQLMNVLFAGESQNYPQISVFWRPEDSGTFDKLPKLVNARATIRYSVKQSQYSKITPGNFGFALTADGKLYAGQMLNLIHKDMIEMMENVVNQVKRETEDKISTAQLYREKFRLIHNGQNTFLNLTSNFLKPQFLTKRLRSLVNVLSLSVPVELFDNIERREHNAIVLKNIIDSDDNETMSHLECGIFIEQINTFFQIWNQKIELELKEKRSKTKVNISTSLTMISEEVSQLLQSKLQSIEDVSTKVNFMTKLKESIDIVDKSTNLTDFVEKLSNLINTSELPSFDHSKMNQVRDDAEYLLGDLNSNEKVQFDIPIQEWTQKVSKINDSVTLHSEQLLESATEDISTLMSLAVKQLTDEINLKINQTDSFKMKQKFIENAQMALPSGNRGLGAITLVYLTTSFAELADKLQLPQNVSYYFDVVQNHTRDVHLLNIFMKRSDNEAIPGSECANILNEMTTLIELLNVGIQTEVQRESNATIASISKTLPGICDEVARQLQQKIESIEETPSKLNSLKTIKRLIGKFDASTTLTNLVEKLSSLINGFEITSIDQSQLIQLRKHAEYLLGDLSSNENISIDIPMNEWIEKGSSINNFVSSYVEQIVEFTKKDISTQMSNSVDQINNEISKMISDAKSYETKGELIKNGLNVLMNPDRPITLGDLIQIFIDLINKSQLSNNLLLHNFEDIKNRNQDLNLLNDFLAKSNFEAISSEECESLLNLVVKKFEQWKQTIEKEMHGEFTAKIAKISDALTNFTDIVSIELKPKLDTFESISSKMIFLKDIKMIIGTFNASATLADFVEKLTNLTITCDLPSFDDSKMNQVRNDVDYLKSNQTVSSVIPMDEWIRKLSSINGLVNSLSEQLLKSTTEDIPTLISLLVKQLIDEINQKFNGTSSYKMKRDFFRIGQTILPNRNHDVITLMYLINKIDELVKKLQLSQNLLEICENTRNRTQDTQMLNVFMERNDNEAISSNEIGIFFIDIETLFDRWDSTIQTTTLREATTTIGSISTSLTTIKKEVDSSVRQKLQSITDLHKVIFLQKIKNSVETIDLSMELMEILARILTFVNDCELTLVDQRKIVKIQSDLEYLLGDLNSKEEILVWIPTDEWIWMVSSIKDDLLDFVDQGLREAVREASNYVNINPSVLADVIKLLIQDTSLGNNNGGIPILSDLHRHYFTVFEAFNKNGRMGKTPLHFAVELDMLDVVEFLIKEGVSIDTADNFGWTPLHVAADNGYLNIMKHLIKNGAQIKKKTNINQTALHMAASRGHTILVEFLIENDALWILEDKDARGKSALNIATEQYYTALVEILKKAAKQRASQSKQLLVAAEKVFTTSNFHILVDIKGNWYQGNSYCRSIGMQLIDVSTKEKSDDVQKAIRATGNEDKSFWTVETKLNANSFYSFSTFGKLNFNNWAHGEPNNHGQNENCMEISSSANLLWNDGECGTIKHIMCERSERPKPITNAKYYIAPTKYNWFFGNSYCYSIGMKLIDVSTKEKNDEIVKIIKDTFAEKESFWTSGNILQSNQWNWLDTGKAFKFTNWKTDEPNNAKGNENCMSLRHEYNWNWNDDNCDKDFRVLCEQ